MPECEKRSTPCARSMHFTHFAQQWNIHFSYPAVISAAPQSRLGKWSRLLNGYSLRSRMDSFQVKHSNTKLDIDYTHYILYISSYHISTQDYLVLFQEPVHCTPTYILCWQSSQTSLPVSLMVPSAMMRQNILALCRRSSSNVSSGNKT